MNLLTVTCSSSQKNSAEFVAGIPSSPFLKDHGFQGMVVLPGSYFVQMAMVAHARIFGTVAKKIQNVHFLSPVILSSTDDAFLQAEITEERAIVRYRFREKGNGQTDSIARDVATVEIALDSKCSCRSDDFNRAEFQARASDTRTSAEFYERLRLNGNQYGPAFQKVDSVWRSEREVLGRIRFGGRFEDATTTPGVDPILLDAVTQLLSVMLEDQGHTFVLRSIGEINLGDAAAPGPLWGHVVAAERTDEKRLSGDIRVCDDAGNAWASLRDVTIQLLDSVSAVEEASTLVVASNFTAEPVEETLRFWAKQFDAPIEVQFAPYNQVFQQLLDPTSAFSKNTRGANLVFLSLEEWASNRGVWHSDVRSGEALKGHKRHLLPNGIEIAHLNSYETEHVYKEIFEDECYLKNGVTLRDGATVVDIGANIGLFSLFVTQRCRDARIYAFEPAPAAYEALKANCEAYAANVRTSNVGVSDKAGTAPFTFYENSSVFSSFHPDEKEDREAIEAVVRNAVSSTVTEEDSVEDYVRELSTERLSSVTIDCPITTVSEIIRADGIVSIDLLKIDAEKSELEILRGIEADDWDRIQQIVMEIHDRSHAKLKQIQELLGERGFHCAVEEDGLLEGSGLVNLYAVRAGASRHNPISDIDSGLHASDGLKRNISDFCTALKTFSKHTPVPLVVCVCPRSPGVNEKAERSQALDAMEEKLVSEAAALANIVVVDSVTLSKHYPVSHYYDRLTHEAGHVPYTPAGYVAIGTAAYRAYASLKRNPYKVIVLDCDNTLWKGVCGEDGTAGVEITKPFLELQEIMLQQQMNAGVLLCLCSKNNEQDVFNVLDQRSEMRLRREHLAAWRINWERKSENIRALAKELNLGLDNFVFLDDNPVECLEVKTNCPEVLTLQLPKDAELLPGFLQHVWAFDRSHSTAEDRGRTQMYQENAQRERFRNQTGSLRDFIEGLELRIEITEARDEEVSRISQLTFRTNQFNLTTVRQSEAEIREALESGTVKCAVVRVCDRFGDYGLTGVLMYQATRDRFQIATFLLSCRVLGRGVEHAVVRWVGQRALLEGKRFVDFSFRHTEKNRPAWEFLDSLNAEGDSLSTCWTLPAEVAARLQYNGGERAKVSAPSQDSMATVGWHSNRKAEFVENADRMQSIGERLKGIDQIVRAMEDGRVKLSLEDEGFDFGDAQQTKLRGIWQKVLGRSSIGMNDNFFEAGGTSLKAVQLVAMIRKELKHDLSIANVFEYPTMKLMSERLGGKDVSKSESARETATRRGQQRRYMTARNPR